MSSQDCIEWAQTQIMAATSKVQRAPNYPDDLRLSVLTAITWADNVKYKLISGGFKQTIFDMMIQIVTPRTLLAANWQLLASIRDPIADIFRDDMSMGGNCSTYDGDVVAKAINGDVDGVKCVGYLFTIPTVKLENQ
jgi:hypothetical protein